MKHNRRLFFLIELGLGLLAGALIFVMLHSDARSRVVAVIISNSDSSAWDQFILGMKQAAQEENLDLIIVGTGRITGASEERALILQELEDGADALIIQPSPGEETEAMLEETVGKVPVILVPEGLVSHASDDQTEETSSYPVIGPDFRKMGGALADMLLEDYAGSLLGKKIGIVNHSLNTVQAADTENGFLDGIGGSGCEVVWTLHGLESSDQAEQEIADQAAVDIVVALDTDCLESAGSDEEAGEIHGAVVYGIGSSERTLYYLDHDNVRGIIFLNGFYMGDQSIREISARLDSRFYSMKGTEIPWMAVRREDLFLEENEDLLFLPQ